MYEVILSPAASTFYAAADRPLASKLRRCFQRLEISPRNAGNIKRLTGHWSGYWRYRIGDWRVIYRIEDSTERISVVVIAHRREVYE
jgi:mRNA interferase RelE/StbE